MTIEELKEEQTRLRAKRKTLDILRPHSGEEAAILSRLKAGLTMAAGLGMNLIIAFAASDDPVIKSAIEKMMWGIGEMEAAADEWVKQVWRPKASYYN